MGYTKSLLKWLEIYRLFDSRGRRRINIILFLTIIAAFLEALGAAAIVPFIALLNTPDYIRTQPRIAYLYAMSNLGSEQQFMVALSVVLIGFYVFKNGYLVLVNHYQFRFVYTEMKSFSERLFSGYMRSPLEFHLQINSAELIRNVSNEVFNFFTHVLTASFIMASEVFVTGALVAMLLLIAPWVTIVASVVLGLFALGFFSFIRPKIRRFGLMQQEHNGERLKWIKQGLGGIKEIKVLRREEYFISRFIQHEEGFAEAARYAMVLNQTPRLFIETTAYVALFIGVGVAFAFGTNPASILPTLALFAVAAVRLLPSVNRIAMSLTRVMFYYPAVDVLRKSRAIPVIEMPRLHRSQVAVLKWSLFKLENITYAYPRCSVPALAGVNLAIARGDRVALLGPSGSGKTTLVDLIVGTLQPASGQILIDDASDAAVLDAWRQRIGFIPQTIFILDDTIRRNVAFGVQDQDIDDEKIWDALERAQLKDHVRTLPEMLDAPLGENGTSFSGGQRQRIGIARALFHSPDVLIMDEATSALDESTERSIAETLDRLPKDITIIVIAHRPETVKRCNLRIQLPNAAVES